MSISTALRNQVMMLDNFTCVYCGYYGSDVQVDHFIPESLGGPDIVQNLVAACRRCNTVKSDRAPYEAGLTPAYGRFAKMTPAELRQPSQATQMRRLIARSRRVGSDQRAINYKAEMDDYLADQGFAHGEIKSMSRTRITEAAIQALVQGGFSRNKIIAVYPIPGGRADQLRFIRTALGESEGSAH